MSPPAALDRSEGRSRVLIIFPGALGDLICLLPAIRAIKDIHSGSPVDLMARWELADFAVGRAGIARAHSIDRREMGLLFNADPAGCNGASGFFAQFVRIHSFFGSGDSGFRRAMDQASAGRASFYPFRPPGAGHVSDGYVASLGITPEPNPACQLEVRSEDIESARRIIAAHGLRPKQYILVMPGSGSPAKNWPAEKFAALVRQRGFGMPWVVALGPAEESIEASFRSSSALILRGLALNEFAGIAWLAAAFVGNDSGVSHLAASVGTSGVVLFGPTEPHRWAPRGCVVIMRRVPLETLTVAEVVEALGSVLQPRIGG